MPPLIYNLFPRLAGTLDNWRRHAERARDMGFNWIFLNPISEPGCSGSLYSVRDHTHLCRDLLPANWPSADMESIQDTLMAFQDIGLKPIMDLVINHTAIDCPLVKTHPQWYKHTPDGRVTHPQAIDPADARKVTVWRDLAEIDNQDSPDREGLWDFWRGLVKTSTELGFCGFRCDAAYKVPADLWQLLIDQAHKSNPDVLFFAETLGCRIEEVSALKPSGLHYLFNSSKYWNFDAPWALDQHAQFAPIAPSVSFPESHDTRRLMDRSQGRLEVQQQRYFLAAMFSKGLLMPIGYEFGFRKRLNVVTTRSTDWENTPYDLCSFIKSVNQLKRELPACRTEGKIEALCGYDQATLILKKTDDLGNRRTFILINKDWHQQQKLYLGDLERTAVDELIRIRPDGETIRGTGPDQIQLQPAEIALIC